MAQHDLAVVNRGGIVGQNVYAFLTAVELERTIEVFAIQTILNIVGDVLRHVLSLVG